MLRTLAGIVLVCASFQVFSQEQLGFRLSNYSGINGAFFNPAMSVNSPLAWDVNIFAAGTFTENNYVFIREASLVKIIRNRYGFALAGQENSELNTAGQLQYDFNTDKRRREGYVNLFVTGPSAMFHVRQHTFGIFFNLRFTASVNRAPASLGYYNVSTLQTGDVLHVKPFKSAGMAWSEAGLNYGYNIYSNGKHTVNAAASVKFLQGYEAYYFQNHEPVNIIMDVDSMQYQDAHVTFGLASGALHIRPNNPYRAEPRGYGASADIGAVYYMQKSKERHYEWKAGLSLLDFGRIVFRDDAQAHAITTETAFDFIQGHYTNSINAEDAFRILSAQSLSDTSASFVDDKFGMWTPAGISVFAERAITANFFVNVAAVRRLRFKGAVPERDNIWAITPRYEKRWYEVSVPLVLYNDKKLRVGAAVRLGPLAIGTDNLTSWFGSRNFTGSDVYIALKVNPMSLGLKQKQRDYARQFRLNDCFEFKE